MSNLALILSRGHQRSRSDRFLTDQFRCRFRVGLIRFDLHLRPIPLNLFAITQRIHTFIERGRINMQLTLVLPVWIQLLCHVNINNRLTCFVESNRYNRKSFVLHEVSGILCIIFWYCKLRLNFDVWIEAYNAPRAKKPSFTDLHIQ